MEHPVNPMARPAQFLHKTALRATCEINAPLPQVWQLLSDVLHWPTWLPTMIQITALDRSCLEVGARFNLVQPSLRPTVWTVTHVDEGSSFTWKAQSLGLVMQADHRLIELGPTSTEAVLEFRFSGWLAPIIRHVFGKLTTEYLQTETASLKATAEATCQAERRYGLRPVALTSE